MRFVLGLLGLSLLLLGIFSYYSCSPEIPGGHFRPATGALYRWPACIGVVAGESAERHMERCVSCRARDAADRHMETCEACRARYDRSVPRGAVSKALDDPDVADTLRLDPEYLKSLVNGVPTKK